jgi:hypothetical protein
MKSEKAVSSGRTLFALSWLSALLVGTQPFTSAHAELYKWVDGQGRTHYGDKPDPAVSKEKTTVMPVPSSLEQPDDASASLDKMAQHQQMMRDAGKAVPMLLIVVQPFTQGREQVAVLRAGYSCTGAAPLWWPDVRDQRPELAPEYWALGTGSVMAFQNFDYSAMHVTEETALAQQREWNGLLLQMRVTKFFLDACAPQSTATGSQSASELVRTLAPRRFQLQMTLEWSLISQDSKVLYSGSTRSKGGNLSSNNSRTKAYNEALTKAVTELLGQQAFQQALSLQSSSRSLIASPTAVAQEAWRALSGLSPAALQQRVQLGSVLTSLSQYKVALTEYYMSEGRWPDHFQQIGVDTAPMAGGATLMLQPGGVLVANLPDSFGVGKLLLIRPKESDSMMEIQWVCQSNLDALPESCQKI